MSRTRSSACRHCGDAYSGRLGGPQPVLCSDMLWLMPSCGFRSRLKSAHGGLTQSQSVRQIQAGQKRAQDQRRSTGGAKRGEATPRSCCRDNLEGAAHVRYCLPTEKQSRSRSEPRYRYQVSAFGTGSERTNINKGLVPVPCGVPADTDLGDDHGRKRVHVVTGTYSRLQVAYLHARDTRLRRL